MTIETKYDLGQRLWEICCPCLTCMVSTEIIKVEKIVALYMGEGHECVIGYALRGPQAKPQPAQELDENYFTTREAAQAECDRRNKEREN